MTTYLYFFWDGFGIGAEIAGSPRVAHYLHGITPQFRTFDREGNHTLSRDDRPGIIDQ